MNLLLGNLLGRGLLGLLGSRLLGCLGLLGLLGGRLLLGLGLLSLGLLGLGLLGRELEGASSLLTSSSGSNHLLGSNQLLECKVDADTSLGSINLVAGNDGLLDGLAGGSLLVAKGLDGSHDHGGVGRVGGRLGGLLGLDGLSSSRHDDVLGVVRASLPC